MSDIQFILTLVPNPEIYATFAELLKAAIEIDEQRSAELLDSINYVNHSINDR